MKRAVCLTAALLLLCCAVLTGCGHDADADDGIDVFALAEEMRAAAELPEMLSISSEDDRAERGLAAVSDLDYSRVEAYSLLYAADGSAYELAVIELKDAADAEALEQSLRKHIENRTQQYRYYNLEQLPRAEGAAVCVSGRCAALIMCDDNAAVKAVFEKGVK